MSNQQLGLLVVGVGLIVILVGLVIWAGGLSWFGRLPGDIRIDRGNVKAFIPITSMLLISLALSALLSILRRIF